MSVKRLDELTYTNFVEAVRTKFRVWIDATDFVELELAKVTTQRTTVAGAKNASYENFALLFTGPANRPLPQRNYCFESGSLGRFELFIVPAGSDAGVAQYQATFNRLAKPASRDGHSAD